MREFLEELGYDTEDWGQTIMEIVAEQNGYSGFSGKF